MKTFTKTLLSGLILSTLSMGLFAAEETIKGKISTLTIGKTVLYTIKTEDNDTFVLDVKIKRFKDAPGKDSGKKYESSKGYQKNQPKTSSKDKNGKLIKDAPLPPPVINDRRFENASPEDEKCITMNDIKKNKGKTVTLKGFLNEESFVFTVTQIVTGKEKPKEKEKEKAKDEIIIKNPPKPIILKDDGSVE